MSGWTCGACGQSGPAGTKFCGHCGTPAAQAAPVPTWSCRECGTANPQTNAFCGGCGGRAQAARTEELRLVTALFADISGFTTLADTLDTESLHEVITPLVRGLTGIAERYEGFIEKFAGDALLVLYGAPVTHEDDPQRALLAALDMHAELPRLLSEIGPHAAHLTIHVGVNTGRVIGRQVGSVQQSDYAVLGDSVILAQRLESACPSGETYVGPSTYELCKDEFEFESVGELTLKGKLEPVEAFRLLGRREAASEQTRPLVGRQDELMLLDDVLARAQSGAGVAVVVAGDAGAGKTRLLAETRARAQTQSMTWLSARCLSYGASLPYWPFVDLLRQQLGSLPRDDPEAAREALAGQLPQECLPGVMRLLGLVDDDAEPQQARREVHDGVIRWLSRQAEAAPVALCVEDVHWADRATRELLAELLRSTRARGLAVLLTTRREGLPDIAPLLSEVDARHVELQPLAASLVPALAAGVLGAPAAPDLVELLAAKAGGNPLFVEELARSLRECDALVEAADGWSVRPGWDTGSVPETVERVFAARLDALPVPAVSLLQVAAVIGRTVRRSLLSAVAERDLQPLDLLTSSGLLDDVTDNGERAVTFHHALLLDVVYGRLLRKRRRELHRRVAEVAQQMYGDADESIGLLARHLYLAEAGRAAAQMLLRAGRRAAALYANEEAALHLRRAAEVLEGLPEHHDLLPPVLMELAEVQETRGEYDEAYEIYERERMRTGSARAWRGVLAVRRLQGDYEQVVTLFHQAGRSLGPTTPEALPLWLECANALALQGRFGDAVSMLRTLLRLPAAEEARLRAEALTRLAWAESQLGLGERALADADEAVRLLDGRGQLKQLVSALRVAGGVHADHGHPGHAAHLLERGFHAAQQLGLLVEAAGCLVNAGFIDLDRDPYAAVPRFREALSLFQRIGNAGGECAALANLADALCRTGELDEAARVGDHALDVATRIGHQLGRADTLHTLARVALARGQHEQAVQLATASAQLFSDLGFDAQQHEALRTAESAGGLPCSAGTLEGQPP